MFFETTFWATLVGLAILVRRVPANRRAVCLGLASWGLLFWFFPMAVLGYSLLCHIAWGVRPRPRGSTNGSAAAWTVVLVSIGALALAKLGVLMEGPSAVAIPVGLSFFALKLVHFVVESRRGTFTRRDPGTFLAYMFLFPAFSAGPIERYEHFEGAFGLQPNDLVVGATRVVTGLIKKFVLVETLLGFSLEALVAGGHAVAPPNGSSSPLLLWLILGMQFLSAYLDFSAYSDLAIGASRMLGVNIAENFNFPLAARSLTDFWQRWHISLSHFCRSYVYMPVLARTRRPVVSMYVSFACIALWHGFAWSWLAWGLWHATGCTLQLLISRRLRGNPLMGSSAARIAARTGTVWWVLIGHALTQSTDPLSSVRVVAQLHGASSSGFLLGR